MRDIYIHRGPTKITKVQRNSGSAGYLDAMVTDAYVFKVVYVDMGVLDNADVPTGSLRKDQDQAR